MSDNYFKSSYRGEFDVCGCLLLIAQGTTGLAGSLRLLLFRILQRITGTIVWSLSSSTIGAFLSYILENLSNISLDLCFMDHIHDDLMLIHLVIYVWLDCFVCEDHVTLAWHSLWLGKQIKCLSLWVIIWALMKVVLTICSSEFTLHCVLVSVWAHSSACSWNLSNKGIISSSSSNRWRIHWK